MDVRSQPRERLFSILNDNDCPSFVIRQRRSPSPKRSSYSPRHERPSLVRNAQYKRSSSFSSDDSTPPLLRFNSSSSKSSNSSMDSSPSPITPAYNFPNPALQYDNGLAADFSGAFMPSPTGITPFMDQSLMIAPSNADPFMQKGMPQQGLSQYPILPAPTLTDIAQLPTPAPSNNSTATSVNKTSPTNSAPAPPTGKKNKYPCPYSQSHNCSATFTTSGHAARHGKKHTGEKGVHCPICNKAFTRKDNMKQHERTHKTSNSSNNSEEQSSRRSKAAVTRDAQRGKEMSKQDSVSSEGISLPSTFNPSPPSDASVVQSLPEMPLPLQDPTFFAATNPMLMPQQSIPENISPNSMYPALPDESLLANPLSQPIDARLPPMMGVPTGPIPMAPTLVRGFSDLDTLAQAAEVFDPCYQQPI